MNPPLALSVKSDLLGGSVALLLHFLFFFALPDHWFSTAQPLPSQPYLELELVTLPPLAEATPQIILPNEPLNLDRTTPQPPPEVEPPTLKVPEDIPLSIPKPSESSPPEQVIEKMNLESLIQEQESELSMVPLPSASLPRALPKGLPRRESRLSQESSGATSSTSAQAQRRQEAAPTLAAPIETQESVAAIGEQMQEKTTARSQEELPAGYFLRAAADVADKAPVGGKQQEEPVAIGRQNQPTGSPLGQDFSGDGFFELSNYNWPYESYMGRWARHLRYAWNSHPPEDYIRGQVPQGGIVYVTVKLNRAGELEEFEVTGRENASEFMSESVVNAILATSQLPELPKTFEDSHLVVRFRFIYPALR